MKPLIVLLIAFLIALVVMLLLNGIINWPLSGNIAMSVMLLFTAIGHFVFTKGMTLMVPPFIPFKKMMVYLTGFIEIRAAIGLLIPSLQILTSLLLIVFFVLMLPCNIYAAVKKVDYKKGNYNGPGLSYLWLRVPLQALFIVWVYFCNLYPA
jgi:uncharacterized membrane protein